MQILPTRKGGIGREGFCLLLLTTIPQVLAQSWHWASNWRVNDVSCQLWTALPLAYESSEMTPDWDAALPQQYLALPFRRTTSGFHTAGPLPRVTCPLGPKWLPEVGRQNATSQGSRLLAGLPRKGVGSAVSTRENGDLHRGLLLSQPVALSLTGRLHFEAQTEAEWGEKLHSLNICK